MNTVACIILFLSGPWSTMALKPQLNESDLEKLRAPTFGTSAAAPRPRKATNSTLYLVDKLLQDFQVAMSDILIRHGEDVGSAEAKTSFGRAPGGKLPALVHSSDHPVTMHKRSSFDSDSEFQAGNHQTPLASLAILGNMKQFFSNLKESLKAESGETLGNQPEFSSYTRKQKAGAAAPAKHFVFPQHMRRMMFGMQPPRPYAHSGLGR